MLMLTTTEKCNMPNQQTHYQLSPYLGLHLMTYQLIELN
jgi:hypothetical protein